MVLKMPVYDYKCLTCGKEFEYQQRITDNALEHCPAEICEHEIKGQGKVERRISKNIGLVFKGSGFYLTDYVHKNNSAAKTNGSTNGTKHTTKEETKPPTETKTTVESK